MNPVISIELTILVASFLLLLSILSSRISDRFGVPALLLFLILGMLAGSEGVGGIYFDNPWLAKFIGTIALTYILFAGGIETKFKDIRPIIWEGISLSTLGVLLTAVCVALFAISVLKFTFLEGLLLGSIISSTDAASVFNILRSKNINLKGNLRPLLELESGSNDPMAVFLTLGTIHLITEPDFTFSQLLPQFIIEVVTAAGIAYLMSWAFLFLINNFKSAYEGLYAVLTLAFVPLIYAVTTLAQGNGFLAVYLAALILANKEFLHKKSLINFHEGIAWLMQITMFLILGLLVFPSKMIPVIGVACLISAFLIFVARPLSVFISLPFSKMKLNEKLMVSWVGLRGAVPIILATFPLLANIPQSDMIFNIVFFIVLTSIFFQGASIPYVSKLLKVSAPLEQKLAFPIEFEQKEGVDANLEEIIVPYGAPIIGKKIFEIGIPDECLVVLLCRDGKFFIPNGASVLEEGDVLQVLGKPTAIKELGNKLRKIL
ncbi:MAG TPA: potassium/proton antiporter [Candidatus Omnitrophota bacterium]|nr:potassium/proton antiporter [Candidatus Omnitrophota bacterium]